ncbi:MAG: ThiF family adenylyltransferase [Verrucomicrobiales bacterium]|nr:ThiF family adenylyltransferase [Verrucomicrobiales bacterium]
MASVFEQRFEWAAAKAAQRLLELFPEAGEIHVDGYPRAWEIVLETGIGNVAAELLLLESFPSSLPKIRVKPISDFRFVIPHVEEDGSLCLTTNAAASQISAPEAAIDHVINYSKTLLESPKDTDFEQEFFSYWRRNAGEGGDVLVLTPDAEIPKQAYYLHDGAQRMIAEDRLKLKEWCKRAGKPETPLHAIKRLKRVDLTDRLLPRKFPKTLEELLQLLEPENRTLTESIRSHVTRKTGEFLIPLRIPTSSGFIDAAVSFTANGGSGKKEIVRGFRKGTVPWEVLSLRAPNETTELAVTRRGVQSVNPQHIRTRGGNGTDLSTKRVAVVGCGSLGGYVAHMLARMGVGHLLLIDNDTLSWDNAGRHVLGGLQVGTRKAEALRKLLQMESPHLDIVHLNSDIRKLLSITPSQLEGVDLVVSTMGVWEVEYDLNYWARRTVNPLPVVFAWIEQQGLAGHALLVHPLEGGCLACGCNEWGEFKLSVTDPEIVSQVAGRGCSGFYQPYGVAEMMPTASMTVKLVADTLVARCRESELRTYLGPKEEFDRHGLIARSPWDAMIQASPHGKFHSQSWAVARECLIGR